MIQSHAANPKTRALNIIKQIACGKSRPSIICSAWLLLLTPPGPGTVKRDRWDARKKGRLSPPPLPFHVAFVCSFTPEQIVCSDYNIINVPRPAGHHPSAYCVCECDVDSQITSFQLGVGQPTPTVPQPRVVAIFLWKFLHNERDFFSWWNLLCGWTRVLSLHSLEPLMALWSNFQI